MERFEEKLNKQMKQAYQKAKKDLQDREPGACMDEELLVSYLENRLNTSEEQEAEKHLAMCSKCSEYVMIMNRVRNFSLDEELPDPSNKVVDKAIGLANQSEKGVLTTPTPHPLKTVFERIGEIIQHFRPSPFAFSAAGAVAAIVLLVVIAVKSSMFKTGVDASSFELAASVVAQQPTFNGSAYSYLQKGSSDPLSKKVVIEDVAGVLRSGDKFQINFRANQKAYIYVFMKHTQKEVFQLFPTLKHEQPIRILKDTEYVLPAADRWYFLDEIPGRTTIYIIATKKLLNDKNKIIATLQSGGISQVIKNFESILISTKILGFVQTGERRLDSEKVD